MKTKKNAKRVQHGNRIHDVFEKLWITQLRILLSCKRQSLQVLPKIAHNVSSPNLTSVIKGYIEITINYDAAINENRKIITSHYKL
ncbi:MAG TPA: hypothetical protein VF465_12675 [Flavobacterium sp.]|uniref:hypothetical protein n=1 Tax=Flavobacterium sp. TaxID=239 RepID=UPI002ED38231